MVNVGVCWRIFQYTQFNSKRSHHILMNVEEILEFEDERWRFEMLVSVGESE